ncbi:MAG: hypothetical protein C0606_11175 [Hyphomicrobiales bacterium]|nr:MAG: hypothetical protein C0606_11175 [Hyphomicrobiales bacterium]
MRTAIVKITVRTKADPSRSVTVNGRLAWTLHHLIDAGAQGITPIERPAPRWSEYVHQLRKCGLEIETIREKHSGPFPGNHGRYVLRTPVEVVKAVSAKERAG